MDFLSDITMQGGSTVKGLPTPVASGDAVPKSYAEGRFFPTPSYGVATAVGQTSILVSPAYKVNGVIMVWLNGTLLKPADYTATDGIGITLASGVANANAEVTVASWGDDYV